MNRLTAHKAVAASAQFLTILLIALLLISCAQEKEQSISFHDKYLEQQVVQRMEDQNISFRREGNTIWYPIENRDVVKGIFDDEVAHRPIQYKFYDKEKQEKFVSLLSDQGVTAAAESNGETSYVVNVPSEHRGKAEEVFQEVLRGN